MAIIRNIIVKGREIVSVDPRYFRPTEVELLIGDPTKAKNQLGWEPKYDLQGLVSDMVRSDVIQVERNKYLKDGGYQIMNYFE
ncbi:MAG: GDP-mannose 4,6-dehydratase [Bacteroidales bacterium]